MSSFFTDKVVIQLALTKYKSDEYNEDKDIINKT